MSKYSFGVDVGGTTIKMGLFDLEGNVLDKWEIKTRTENGGVNVLPDIAEAIKAKIREANHPMSAKTEIESAMKINQNMMYITDTTAFMRIGRMISGFSMSATSSLSLSSPPFAPPAKNHRPTCRDRS